jgi:hypothetical protein
MNSSITPLTAASGDTRSPDQKRPGHGLPELRQKEAKGLISLGMDALSQASSLGHDIHSVIYDTTTGTERYPQLREQLNEVLTCLETAEHYLFMLGSVFEEPADRTRPLVAVLNK